LALQCVQPFALGEEVQSAGVEWSTPADQELLTDGAWALNTVRNIDKHRRLPEIAWGRDSLFWWQGAGQDSVKKWRTLVPSGSFLEDNQLILELGADQGNGRPDVKLTQEINLLLVDDPSPYKRALGECIEQLHQSLSGWVLPRIFITADGNPPPIMISFHPRSDPRTPHWVVAICSLIALSGYCAVKARSLILRLIQHLIGAAVDTQIGGYVSGRRTALSAQE
jgi:hypothetical protein